MNITAEQCRTARCLLGWTQDQLAAEANIATKCVYDFEGRRRKGLASRTQRETQAALEAAGVTLLFDHNGRAIGVRLTDSDPVDLSEEAEHALWPQPLHFRIARAWLGWSSSRLAEEAGVSTSVVRDFDKDRHIPRDKNLIKIELAIKLRGIRFLFDRDNRPIGITVVNGLAVAA